MIKAVIFDFFGVLVTEGFKQFREDYFSEDEVKREEAVQLINQVDSGDIPMHSFTSQLAELAGITPEEVQKQLGGNKPNKPLLAYIAENLKGKYKIGILSNSSMDFPRQLLDQEDVELFDDIILSYRLGMVKPQPEIYKTAVSRLKINPGEAVFIDDSEGHVDGAKLVGMKGILYKDFPQMKNDLQIILSAVADK